MIGHGQVEGYGEKYGMEFRRPLWDETPDPGLIERHEREIFPLMRQRPLFAGVEHFLLYDFFTPDGSVNEDVYAYSNRLGDERALVLYHNAFADTRGWVRTARHSQSDARTRRLPPRARRGAANAPPDGRPPKGSRRAIGRR